MGIVRKKMPSCIYFACDAGVGSSAMAAALLRRKLKQAGIRSIQVKNCAIEDIPEDAELVFALKQFEELLRRESAACGRTVQFYFVENLMEAAETAAEIETAAETLVKKFL